MSIYEKVADTLSVEEFEDLMSEQEDELAIDEYFKGLDND